MALEGYHRAAVGSSVDGRSSDDRAASHLLHGERAADTTEVVAIEKIGLAVLAEGQHQVCFTMAISHIQRERTNASKILIVIVEGLPVGRCEVVTGARRTFEIGAEPHDGLTIGPFLGVLGVAGGDEERAPVVTHATGRPHATSFGTRGPNRDRAGIVEAYSHYPAVIRSAVTEVPAIRYKEHAVDDHQRTALVLYARRECEPARPDGLGDVHREAGKNRAIIDCQAKH